MGISGTGISKRAGINQLVELAKNREIDLILTKSISRFARNTADLLRLTTQLNACGTEVIFEKENISSLSSDGALMLSLMGVFAQSESESISSNIKWRILKDRENGISTPHSKVIGYDWIGGRLVKNAPEAEVVEEIFSLYRLGLSGREIARELNERTDLPATLSMRHFDTSSIYYILRNPIYCGNLLMGKYYTTSPINGRIVKNHGERDMYLVEDDHEAIVSKSCWNEVQEEIIQRTKRSKTRSKPCQK